VQGARLHHHESNGIAVPGGSRESSWRGRLSLCKVSKQTTGLRFTDYVARARLEDAKTELLNPNRRISEIAYDAGFQSLTQFNRTFHRVFGQSPTEFRAHLGTKPGRQKTA
jgi:AraC-like DNA-binding protein